MVGGSSSSGSQAAGGSTAHRRGPPARTFAAVVAAVVLAHAWLMAELRESRPEAARPRGAPVSLLVRQLPAEAIALRGAAVAERDAAAIDRPAVAPIDAPGRAPTPVRPMPARHPPRPMPPNAASALRPPQALATRPPQAVAAARPPQAVAAARPPQVVAAARLPQVVAVTRPPQADAAARRQAAPIGPVEPASADRETAEDAPTYRTRLPPGATLEFALRRGAEQGTARLTWRPDADGYALTLEGTGPSGPLLLFDSRGGFDAAGLAPVRYTDRRARRSALAINFERASGRVSFSASRRALALRGGEQDRVSWLIQLAAVLAAEARLREPGAQVWVPVAGLRGDSATWRFRVAGFEDVSTGSGVVPALKLQRASPGGYDPGVDVWLDPARHHLPIRVVLGNGVPGQALELLIQDMTIEP